MSEKKKEKGLLRNPLNEEEVLTETFFSPASKKANRKSVPQKPVAQKKKAKPKPKPDHYKICCISLYREDIEHLEGLVSELKSRGYTKANKSQVIRFALATVNLDDMPKMY